MLGSLAFAGLRTVAVITVTVAAAVLVRGSAAQSAIDAQASARAFTALVAAAKQEGTVVINGPPLDPVRDALTDGFKKKYGINVVYETGGGPAAAVRTRTERAAGKYLLDVLISGSDTPTLTFLPSGWLDPIEPILVEPDAIDPRAWKDGHVWYVDPQHTILRLLAFITPELAVNTKLVKPRDLTTWHRLLDPRWVGKIVVKDPSISGAGASLTSYFYQLFGADYVKQLYVGQKPILSRDPHQAVQWLAQGNYPILVGPDSVIVDQFQKLGYPIAMISPTDGPQILSGGFGLVALINRAPHPNAAKLYINWLAGHEGSDLLAQSLIAVSLRNDVSTNGVPAYEIPRKNGHYFDSYDYKFITVQRDEAQKKAQELLGL